MFVFRVLYVIQRRMVSYCLLRCNNLVLTQLRASLLLWFSKKEQGNMEMEKRSI